MSPEVRKFLEQARVGHLATVDGQGRPSVVPICFVVHKNQVFSVLDEKPKRADVRRLKRVRNLAENAYAAVVVDRWDEDWRWLAWVHMRGKARTEEPGDVQRLAVSLLRAKYPQYREMNLDDRPVIVVDVEVVRTRGNLG
jgi:PPOX class probable F420-dependent enzyme